MVRISAFLLFLISTSSFAQDQRIADSLINILAEAKYDESNRIQILDAISFNHNDPYVSIGYANKLLELAREQRDFVTFFRAYYLIGTKENIRGNLDEAADAFISAAEYANKLDDRDYLTQVYLSLGDVYSNQENHDRSISYYNMIIDEWSGSTLDMQEEDSVYLATALTNLGYEFYRVDLVDSSLIHFARASKLFKDLQYESGALYCLGNTGLVYAKMGQYDLAERSMQEAISKLTLHEDYYAISDFQREIAEIYRQKGNLSEALRNAESSFHLADQKGLKIQARDAAYKLYEIAMDQGRFEESIGFLNQYYALRDSIINSENIKRIADLRTAYEVGQKQTEVDLLTIQKQNQLIVSVSLAALVLALLVLAIIIYKYYRSKNRVNMVLQEQKAKLEALNQTKDKFFSIISHDLRGPVSSFHGISRMIKYYVDSKNTDQLLEVVEDIDQSVDRVSALLDNLLKWAMQQQGQFSNIPEKLRLSDLTDDLVKTLQAIAKGKNIHLMAEIDEQISLWADKNMVMTILRNLVSNSLKFTEDGGCVEVTATEVGDCAEIRIRDNGVGIPADKLDTLFKLRHKKSTFGTSGEKGLGLGLMLVHEFVEMNRGEVHVESKPNEGTTFIVRLPLFEATKVSA